MLVAREVVHGNFRFYANAGLRRSFLRTLIEFRIARAGQFIKRHFAQQWRTPVEFVNVEGIRLAPICNSRENAQPRFESAQAFLHTER